MVKVHRRYGAGDKVVHALYDIDLCVEAGEMVAVCGPSGHGNTALVNLLGLLDLPSAGRIYVQGVDTCTLTERQRQRLRSEHIGIVFQHPALLPALTALENTLLPVLLGPHVDRSAIEFAPELLARLGLAVQLHKHPDELDASQRQRVAIARALVLRPALVVADEPASRLDSGSERMVADLFSACQREHGTTFIMATRDQRQLLRASRTLQLSEGRLLSVPADTPRRALRA
nr:ATP-binding cassette domain-containing protein [Massilia terrae]